LTIQAWDGPGLLAALRQATATLHAGVDEVNALNVFPVPDGDTGSNMLATMQAAIREAEAIADSGRTVPAIAAALSFGALMGARGNSGVILSQLFRGIGESVADVERIDGAELAQAIDAGRVAAFGAVTQPVEGTILTVARAAAAAAVAAARNGGPLDEVLAAAVSAASESVARTPELLPVLRRAGVVDAGGRGLELLLKGALAATRGEQPPLASRLPHDIPLPLYDALEAEGYGYETVFLLTPNNGRSVAIGDVRRKLDHLGQSVLVVGDDQLMKVHVHTERPDEVIGYGLTLGTLTHISVENLDRQAGDVRQRAPAAAARAVVASAAGLLIDQEVTLGEPDAGLAAAVEGDQPQVVSVAAGEGLSRLFRSLGAAAVVDGGNPSAGELAQAIGQLAATQVIVLPNNPNVRLAARQAGQLSPEVRVEVVPTRNPAEGVAAILALDASLPVREAARRMAQAARRVQTFQVTVAVRDARIGRHRVRHGEYIVLGPNDGLLATDRDRTAAVRGALRKLKPGYELLTIYRGRDVDQVAADDLRATLAAELENIEIELVEGGQPHYDFLFAAE
jgi:DAK2 domain fusion protein YloV